MSTDILLSVQGLTTAFATDEGDVVAVEDVSFDLEAGKVTALVGESGCGKSAAALSLMRLIRPPGRIVKGSVWLEGRDLLRLPEAQMRLVRGKRLAMIFQEPTASLNPTMRIGAQVAEALSAHASVTPGEAKQKAIDALAQVGIPAPADRCRCYPHELSGGMRQRAMIAMALVCEPTLLIADEPTTALDVTIQAQILDLLLDLRDQRGLTILLITHDLGVVAEAADHVLAMYAGQIVESGPAGEVLAEPRHPYVADLLASVPQAGGESSRLKAIPGTVPAPLDAPPGCRYAPRCARAVGRCRADAPVLEEWAPARACACWCAGEPSACT